MHLKKHVRSAQGFTMLEMALVLFIIVLIIGVAIPVVSGLISEEKLRQHANVLRQYARTARRLAVTENQAYEIRFSEKAFSLEPYVADEKKRVESMDHHAMSGGASYSIERWGAKKFSKPGDESWVFQPDGICEPLRVHFQSGKNWIEFAFNPLTARAEDETYHFP